MMYGPEKSDSSIVAVKPANKAGQPGAERAEPRDGTKGNTSQPRTWKTRYGPSTSVLAKAQPSSPDGRARRSVPPRAMN
jgi:hypothetical protein